MPGHYASAVEESALLAAIAKRSQDLGTRFPHVRTGPGDDCAAVRIGNVDCLLTVDQVIEGRHFRRGTPLDLIARKAVARSVSDIAAMAGTPVCALATGAFPKGFPQASADELSASLKRWAEHWRCPLVGGDLASMARESDPLVLTVTAIGTPHGVRGPVLRSGARPGDFLYVSGALGGSFEPATGLGRHLTFEPRIELGRRLADLLGQDLHAMMDISDGLGRDASRMAEASGVRLELEASSLPFAAGVSHWKHAAGDGEDYELLFAAPGGIDTAGLPVPITRIGRVVEGNACVFLQGGRECPASELGWEHR